MDLVDQVETIFFDFLNRCFLVPIKALHQVVCQLLRRIDLLLKVKMNFLWLVLELKRCLKFREVEGWDLKKVGEVVEKLPDVKKVLKLFRLKQDVFALGWRL